MKLQPGFLHYETIIYRHRYETAYVIGYETGTKHIRPTCEFASSCDESEPYKHDVRLYRMSSKQRDPNPNNNSLIRCKQRDPNPNNAANVEWNPSYVDVLLLIKELSLGLGSLCLLLTGGSR